MGGLIDFDRFKPYRRVPAQFTEGHDKHNAQKAWLDGFDAATRIATAPRSCNRCGGTHDDHSMCDRLGSGSYYDDDRA